MLNWKKSFIVVI